jgi:pimeloyl-ACP methyl ester carboxylesterase
MPAPSAPPGSRTLRFEAIDGVGLEGRLFGSGRTGVVLSYMGNPGDSQADWYGVAEVLAERGYTVLTYDRRGVCPGGIDGCSSGNDTYWDAWQDVLGAVRFLTRKGVGEVFVGGASIGAMASLYAAEQPGVEVAGVIWVAGLAFASGYLFQRKDVRRVAVPTLFVSATRDPYAAAESARRLHRWANPPTSLVLLRSDEHGTDMLSDPADAEVADALTRSIIRFVDRFAN